MQRVFLALCLLTLPIFALANNNFHHEILQKLNAFRKEIQKRQLNDNELIGRSRLEQVNDDALSRPNLFTVVIDAGHGGKDPGALGAHGTKEKTVVLSIAQKLAKEINSRSNMRAILTRNGDYYVPLRTRLRLARRGNADIFIAIHADASYYSDAALGASVFCLSERGASSEAARWLAQRDNYSELDGVELNSLTDHDPMLRSVLVDLAQTATIQDSVRLGTRVLDELDDISSLHYPQVERAPFVVLKSPDIPSILVETGFITNPREEKRLINNEYQNLVAHALWKGINRYFLRYGARRV